GEWYQGDTYIFVGQMDGVEVCHPARPELEGKSLLDLKDPNGKLVTRSFLRALSGTKRAGWSHYLWPRSGQQKPAWKTTYLVRVTAPSGKEYFVGSGIYPTRTDRMFAVSAVNDAVALIRREGDAAYPALRDRSGDFLFGDLYVLSLDQSGRTRVHPASQDREGRNQMDLRDASGKPIIREMFRTVASGGSGWVSYRWPKPGNSQPSHKTAYVRKVSTGGK